MKPDEIQAFAAIAQTVLALVAVLCSIAVSLFVYFGSVRVAKSQYLRTVFDAWMALDTCLLDRPELLQVVESIDRHGRWPGQPEDSTKRMVACLLLNPLCSFYYGVINGYIEKQSLTKLEKSLARLIRMVI